jgi:hypothetical protein
MKLCALKRKLVTRASTQNRYRAEASLMGKKCARMSADFRCGRHVESNQTRGNFIGVYNMAEPYYKRSH